MKVDIWEAIAAFAIVIIVWLIFIEPPKNGGK